MKESDKSQIAQILNFCFNGIKSLYGLNEIKFKTNKGITVIARRDQIIINNNKEILITKTGL